MNKTNTIPLIGLCEMENIVTIVADGWAEKIVSASEQVTNFLAKTDKNVLVIAKDPAAANKLQKQLPQEPQIITANMKNDYHKLSDLSNIYAMVVVDSGLFNDYTKYLLSLQARDNGCRLVFVL